jgi:hypothetical protein
LGRGGNKELRQFLALAKSSAGEVRSQLYVALDAGYMNTTQFEALYEQTKEVSRLLAGFMRYLETSELQGHKFKEPPGPSYEADVLRNDNPGE